MEKQDPRIYSCSYNGTINVEARYRNPMFSIVRERPWEFKIKSDDWMKYCTPKMAYGYKLGPSFNPE